MQLNSFVVALCCLVIFQLVIQIHCNEEPAVDTIVATGLDGGEDPHPPTVNVMEAIRDKNAAGISQYIAQGGDINNFGGVSPVIHSALSQFNEGLKILLEHGANVDAVEGDGWSALMFSAAQGNKEGVELLLKYNPNPFLLSKKATRCAYDYAVDSNFEEIAKILLAHSMQYALQYGDQHFRVMRLARQGADLKTRTSTGFTPLLTQCAGQNLEGVIELISKFNVNYNEHENDGWNCLTFASYFNHVEMVKYLLTLPHIDIGIALNRAQDRGNAAVVSLLQNHLQANAPAFSMSYSMAPPADARQPSGAEDEEADLAAKVEADLEAEAAEMAQKEREKAAEIAIEEALKERYRAEAAALAEKEREQAEAFAAIAAEKAQKEKQRAEAAAIAEKEREQAEGLAAAKIAAEKHNTKKQEVKEVPKDTKPKKSFFSWLLGK